MITCQFYLFTLLISITWQENVGTIIFIDQAPDGSLFYCDLWGGVRRIGYTNGNQAPVILSATVFPPAGPAPLTVWLNASVEDKEGEALSYTWVVGTDRLDGPTNRQ